MDPMARFDAQYPIRIEGRGIELQRCRNDKGRMLLHIFESVIHPLSKHVQHPPVANNNPPVANNDPPVANNHARATLSKRSSSAQLIFRSTSYYFMA